MMNERNLQEIRAEVERVRISVQPALPFSPNPETDYIEDCDLAFNTAGYRDVFAFHEQTVEKLRAFFENSPEELQRESNRLLAWLRPQITTYRECLIRKARRERVGITGPVPAEPFDWRGGAPRPIAKKVELSQQTKIAMQQIQRQEDIKNGGRVLWGLLLLIGGLVAWPLL